MLEVHFMWSTVGLKHMIFDSARNLRKASEGFAVELGREAEFWRTNAIKPEV